MSNYKRRDFIKKSILTGLVAKTALEAFGNKPKLEFYNSDFKPVQDINPEKYWSIVKNQFKLDRSKHYFNTAGLGASPNYVIDTLVNWTNKINIEAETFHEEIEKVRQQIANFLNAGTDEIGITRNATESMNIVARSLELKSGDEVILTTHEHVGGAAPWLMLQKEPGIKINLVDLDLSGQNNFQLIKEAVTKRTKVICVSHVTCTTGMILPVKEIASFCRENDIYSCIDGAQAVGMIAVNLGEMLPDFYVMSGHKWLYGPKGSGMLYINRKIIPKIKPVFAGAYTNTEYDLNELKFEFKQTADRIEYGTRNTAHTKALGAAFDFINEIGIDNIQKRGRQLAQRLTEGLKRNPKVEILSPESEDFTSSIVTFRIKGKNYEDVQKILMKEHNIRTRGIYENYLDAIRISCAVYNNPIEIDMIVGAINSMKK